MPPSPIPILHFDNSLGRGGVEEYILTLLRRLDRRRFRPYLACGSAVAEMIVRDVPPDVELLRIDLRGPRHAAGAARLARALRDRRIGILHCHLFWSSLFASPVARLCGVPVVIETPHIRELWRKGLVKGSYFIDRCVGRLVDRYVAVSLANAKYLVEVKGIPARKIETIYFGCALDRFHAQPARNAGLRAGLGFGETDVLAVAVARLEPQKGHAVLLGALRRARERAPNLKLACVGDGRLRGELEDLAGRLGLRDAVRFTGFRSDVQDWYAAADFSVLPSFFEGLPLVAIESLAAGCPVVATAVDGTPEVLGGGRYGLLTPPGDEPALAEALLRMAGDAQLRAQVASAGRAWVLERFTEERFVRETEEFYLRAWNATGKPSYLAAAARR